jgi:predicted dehydrogenase
MTSRRNFIKKAIGTAIVTGAATGLTQGKQSSNSKTLVLPTRRRKTYAANDKVNIGCIGMGIMGFNNMNTSTHLPGIKLVGACDLYTGRLDHAKEVFGNDLFTTKNYQELLDRKDIDAIFVCTTDHWHDRISIDAMNKGKHVYCEKPMVHKIEEGQAVIDTQKKTGKVFQVGSQRASAIVTQKAKELFESGVIGDLVLVETYMDRHNALGAWQYSIPTDAGTTTVDWDHFLGNAPKVAFDPVRFFRWRNYQDYGTGIAGDLFVHLFTGLHCVTSSKGPNRIYGTGGLRYFKDGRDVPDIITSVYDYPATDKHPAFTLQMRVNFVDGSEGGESLKLVGTDGVIIVGWDDVWVKRHKMSKAPGYGGWDSFNTFTVAQQKEYEKWYKAHYPQQPYEMVEPDLAYSSPKGYSANDDHHLNFYAGIREGKAIREDALFSMRACGPALATNKSIFEKKIINWDPETAKVV